MEDEIKINIVYGSEWQKEVFSKMFRVLLRALKFDFESKHKKNQFNIEDKERG
jgi:hypothetical protein